MSSPRDEGWLIRVGLASCGIAAGAKEVYNALSARLGDKGLGVTLKKTGCIGMCYNEPLIEVVSPRKERTFYKQVTPDKINRIISEHLIQGKLVTEWAVPDEEINRLLAKQQRIVLRNCGIIDPESIDDYLAVDGYKALKKALSTMSPDEVIGEVTKSGLRGRGGAGFPTGVKWGFARKSSGELKYLICNADEGDPGAFMDRSVLESDPHSVIEGMLIAGYAIGASQGYIYVRAEYPLAINRLELALADAKKAGFIGETILDSNFSFDIKIRQGAGAFVCGEETALLMSLEGRRGMPRVRPPFPAQSGLWGKPTNINNVETLANIAWIILHGASVYSKYGTEKSRGTKVFALAGKIVHGGLIEVPMGITLREIVFDIGGGTSSGLELKAIQIGGPSGGIIPASLMDTPVDYDSLTQTGAIMGSGGLIVMDETSCMIDIARFFLNFIQKESCGKCPFCRIGTRRMLEILERITEGNGKKGDIELLAELAQNVKRASLCGLGQTAPNPVLTTIRYFRNEYEEHIYQKKCRAKKCHALINYTIIPEKCTGCGVCAKYCPVEAISGEKKQPHLIDSNRCIRCGLCMKVCRFDAVSVGSREENA
ncbi:MAG: NADH-quinone oxidoreductase subunit NuoF [Dehalococcoidales bacterium]|nr:NADH-quinone oxidoreductase subunit NuoF [Dehalococcoidales bacterium]